MAAEESSDESGQPPIYLIYAEKVGPGAFCYHGRPRYGPTRKQWEALEPEWVDENFGPGKYPTFLVNLCRNHGQAKIVPEGRATTRSSAAPAAPAGSFTEGGIIHQGTEQLCATYPPQAIELSPVHRCAPSLPSPNHSPSLLSRGPERVPV